MTNPRLFTLLAIFAGLLIGMNLLGAKITTVFGISASVGIFMVPLTFLITDIVEEVYGKAMARQFIISGLTTIVVLLAFTAFFVWLTPHPRFTNNDAYTTIFGSSLRIMVASILAFALAQLHDMYSFAWIKGKTGDKMLWLRNNVSTIVSQFIDTMVFMFVAFYMMTPMFTATFVLTIAIPYFLFKMIFGIIETPLVYVGVKWLKGGAKYE